MSEQSAVNYLDGEIVWVKLGSCWWPGEVVAVEKLPADVLPSFRKPPIAIVKFFQEDAYEYVKNTNSIEKYECSRKIEFIKKGISMYRTKHGLMEKFPGDVIHAETAVGGDPDILTQDEFQEQKKPSYAGLFGDPKKTPSSMKKGKNGRGRPDESPKFFTPTRKMKEKTDYKVHILLQGSKTPSKTSQEIPSTPSTSGLSAENSTVEAKSPETEEVESVEQTEKPTASTFSTPTPSSSGIYACHACPFTTQRLNVLILHNKTHSLSFMPYTPSPVRKKVVTKKPRSSVKNSETRKPRPPKTEKPTKKVSDVKKRAAVEVPVAIEEPKKAKTDEEIKTSLLADWDDDVDDDSNDESSTVVMTGSPEVAVVAESPAIPTEAELPSAQVPDDVLVVEKKSDESPVTEKAESTSDSKYEFCEDEDWTVETDAGRKIPRVKNPKRKDETKSISLDEDDVAREVAEILSKTSVPELPSVPEPLKAEENFPQPPVVKSPDKNENKSPEKPAENPIVEPAPTKAIFKTKTFFRSRHSRSQDAIGKYVAEQLNAVERMDISESEINGSDAVSSPEARDSPPIEPVKVARLAPKIQLKKMKAEAAQLREKEKHADNFDIFMDENPFGDYISNKTETIKNDKAKDDINIPKPESMKTTIMDVLYPTQEIKPINADTSDLRSPIKTKVDQYFEVSNDHTKKDNISTDREEKGNQIKETFSIPVPEVIEKFTSTHKAFEPMTRYMNESTASAVDALLSVSRETDRVTRVISNDPPEDLFEDDNKDLNVNGNYKRMEYEITNNDTINETTKTADNVTEPEQFVDNNFSHEISNIDEEKVEESNNSTEVLNKDNNHDTNSNDLAKDEDLLMKTDMNIDTAPSESDLQIAEALINLPSTAIQSKTNEHHDNLKIQMENEQDHKMSSTNEIRSLNHELSTLENNTYSEEVVPMDESLTTGSCNVNYRYETEQEKSENLNAAKSLVQMSETIDHQINIIEPHQNIENKLASSKPFNIDDHSFDNALEQKMSLLSNCENNNEPSNGISTKIETSTPKLLKILEEPCTPKVSSSNSKQVLMPRKEKILNFDVAKSSMKGKAQPPKQKIIIRRTTPNKNIINSISEITASPDKIILSRTNNPVQDGSSVQTYTIQTTPEVTSDANTIIIQQKLRKVAKPPTKIQKIRPSNSLIVPMSEKSPKIATTTDDTMFDINSMPIVLSEDLLTAENIEKMPVVMSGSNTSNTTVNSPKMIKTKVTAEVNEKLPLSATPKQTEVKTLLMNPVSEATKATTPNILSKSSKLRGAKPMLVIDKTTGKQKIIMTKPDTAVKEIKSTPIVQPPPKVVAGGKTEKFIILPTPSSPRPTRTQKIVIDPQTGKAHVLVTKGPDSQASPVETKQVSAKLMPSSTEASTPGNTVMIITNAQGAQSRILLKPEHEKILFPNKQQPNVSQLKSIAHGLSSNTNAQKTVTSMTTTIKSQKTLTPKIQPALPAKTHVTIPPKPPTRIVPKQKSAIITSKGQLIVGGRVATTAQNIAPMPEIRPAPKRILAPEPKKIVQTVHKTTEPLIFLQQKSGTMMQLTAAQFEHLQKTGQIVQKPSPAQETKMLIQKSITLPPTETPVAPAPKPRVRKQITESPAPLKKLKQEIAIAPAPTPNTMQMPVLAPLSSGPPSASMTTNAFPTPTTTTYNDYDNFEELLPSTTIAKNTETVVSQPEQTTAPLPAPLADNQLLAVPGEPFGGPPGSFYLCVEDNGTLTPIDNRPLILENNQLVPMAVESLQVIAPPPERRDILEAALANSDVFHADTARDDAPDFRDLNANVSVHCRVSETSTTLNQPIMTPVEMPSKVDSETTTVPSNLEDGLAVIGVTPHAVPTSLELPITVTDPRIAPKTTDPLSSNNYGTTLLASPNTEMTFVSTEECIAPITATMSMPLLNEDDSIGKSMPILSDDIAEKTISSVESNVGSPSSADVRESENEDSTQWTRRLFTPGSDISETSTEIPLQPALQLSVNEASRRC